MTTKNDVEQAIKYQGFEHSWGYFKSLTIWNVEHPVEWIEFVEHVEGNYNTDLLAVFSIELDGAIRYFSKTGHAASHDGEYWDGPFEEVVPEPVEVVRYKPVKRGEFNLDDLQSAFVKAQVYWGDFDYQPIQLTINGVYYVTEPVTRVGDGEGEIYVVFKIEDRLFRKYGYNESFYGTEWDGDLEEVEEYEKTVKNYRKVSK